MNYKCRRGAICVREATEFWVRIENTNPKFSSLIIFETRCEEHTLAILFMNNNRFKQVSKDEYTCVEVLHG